MKKFLKLFFAISALALLFTSCGKNSSKGNMIPSDALFVAHANMKSLDSKVPWNDIKQTQWYQKAYADPSTPEWRKKILENPSASGINFDEGLIFFAAKNLQTGYYIAAEGTLKSEKDFEQFNKNFDSTQKVRKEGDISLLTLKDKNVVGWNSDHFVYIMNPETTASQMYRYNDSSSLQVPEDNSEQLVSICKKLFSLKSDSSLANNDKFNALLKENGDIHLWQNNEALMKSAPSMGMLGMLKLDAFIKDNVSTYTVNFDNGKIEVAQKAYLSKELYDILKKYTGSSVNKDMIKNIPSQNVIGLLAMNFKPEGLEEIIKLTGADGLVNTYSQQIGFGLDDVSKATNGDLLLSFSDLKIKQKDSSGLNSEGHSMDFGNVFPDFNYIFSVGIGDKASLQKIIDAVTKVSSQFGKDSMVNYVMSDKIFAQSNTNTFAKQYLAGNNNKYDFTDKFSGHPFGFYLDIHKLLTVFSSEKTNKTDDSNAMLNESLNMWNNIISYGGDFKDNAITAHSEINMINKDTNSLKQLNNYINKMYTLDQKRKSESTAKLDSLLTPPPIDTVKVK